MRDIKHARLMADMAAADLQAICHMTDPSQFADSVFGFHCQQSVEKLCKAWLSLVGIEYPRTHDLRTLFHLIESHDPEHLTPFIDLVDLTDYAVQFRYEAPLDLDSLDRPVLSKRIRVFYLLVESLFETGPKS